MSAPAERTESTSDVGCPYPWLHEYQAEGYETNCGGEGCPYPTLADDLDQINRAAARINPDVDVLAEIMKRDRADG